MTAELNLGNYQIDEDSNGDLVIKDSNGNTVLQWDNSAGNWTFNSNKVDGISQITTTDASIANLIANLDINGNDLVDGATTVYDTSNTAIGAGSLSANLSSLLGALDVNGNDLTDSGTTLYDASADTVGDGTTSANHSSVNTGTLQGGVANSLTVSRIMGERVVNKTPSNQSTVDITTGINSDYDRYILEIVDLVPDTDQVNCELLVSSDGGSTFATSSGDYWAAATGINSAGTTTDFGSETHSSINLTVFSGNVGSAAGESLSATLSLSNPANTSSEQLIRFECEYHSAADNLCSGDGAYMYTTAEAIDALRLRFSSGNIESGTVNLYGMMS